MPRPKGTSTSRKPKTSKIIPKNASVTSTNTKRPIGGKAGAKKTATTEPPAKTSDIATSARKKHLGAVSEAEFDGGLFALAGYVNQMLGSAADLARCLSGKAAESGGFKTLLCFETEVHGQDSSAIGLTAEKHGIRVLKQYKYSSNPEKYPIRPKELREIAATLKQSEAKANTTKSLQTDLVLCTNRPVTAKAQATSDYKTLRLEPYHALKARAELESYAARFGVFNPDELHEGVRRAIDYLFEAATSASHRVTKSLFEEKLIGHKQPRSIAVAEAAFERRQELCRLATELLILAPASLAEREIINSATVDWMNDALIVFVGEGGCGKTTALWQLLWDAINTQPPQRLAQMMISQGQTSQSFGAVVERWRGIVSAANMPSDDLALERLKQANPAVAPPIVLLGLDGIDETPSPTWSDTAARVLSFFWSLHVRAKNDGIAPPARLFVSCRRESEVERLLPIPTGAGLTRAAPRYVHFGEFNSKELTDLVHHTPTLDPLAADRISKSLIDGFEVAETDSGPPALFIPTPDISPSNLNLLKHPILWRSFASLDAKAQIGVLAGSTEAQDQLGAAFLQWFCERVHRRVNIEKAYVPVALRSVAHACQNSAETYRLDKWMRCVQSTAGYTETEAKDLYHESVSSGLVQDIPPAGGSASAYRSWRWKHIFLAEYLQRSWGQ